MVKPFDLMTRRGQGQDTETKHHHSLKQENQHCSHCHVHYTYTYSITNHHKDLLLSMQFVGDSPDRYVESVMPM